MTHQIQSLSLVQSPSSALPSLHVYLILEFSQYLSYADLRAMSIVCRDFYNFVKSGIFCVRFLNASKSKIGETISSVFISRLSDLIGLDLSNNFMRVETLKPILLLTQLRKLNLSSSLVELEGDWSALKKLEILNLSKNFIKIQNLTTLRVLESVTELDISGNNSLIKLPSDAITSLTKLEILNISKNPLGQSTIEVISLCMSLRCLDISECWIGLDGALSLGGLTNLESLKMRKTALIATGVCFSRLTKLSLLEVAGNGIYTTGLTQLAMPLSLTCVDLARTKMEDASLIHLTHLTNLREINLEGNEISDTALQEFAKLKPFQKSGLRVCR